MMIKMIKAGLALRHASEMDHFVDPDAITLYAASVIPEIQGIVRTDVSPGMVHGTIRSIVSGFVLSDPVTIASSIKELCEVEITDSLSWVSAMTLMAEGEEDPGALKHALTQVKQLTGKEVIEQELAFNLAQHIATLIVSKTLLKEDVQAADLMKRAKEIVASI